MKKYCSKCGTKLNSNESYCPECGAKLDSVDKINENKPVSNSVDKINENKPVSNSVDKNNENKPVNNKNKKLITLGVIIIIVAIIAVVGYTMMMNNQIEQTGEAKGLDGKTETEVLATEPISVESQVETMKSGLDMGYNNETITWLEGLTNYVYVDSDSSFIIMNRSEANKLPIMEPEYSDDYTNNTYHYNKIKFNVLETHSMGSGLKDCILVNQVEVTGNTSKVF